MTGVDKFGRQVNYSETLRVAGNENAAISTNKVSLDGSNSMSGNLNMDNHNITNLPIETNQLVSNSSVCSYAIALGLIQGEDSLVLHNYGGTMTGDLLMGGNLVKNLIDPIVLDDIANKGYVDNLMQYKLNNTGGTVSGNLLIDGHLVRGVRDPVLVQDAASKNYVDGLNNLKVFKSGDIMWGNLNNHYITNMPDPIAVGDSANKRYVDNLSGVKKCYSGYVPDLFSNVNKTGFVASSSTSYSASFTAANAFMSGSAVDWATAGITTNFWIKIKCPELVRVWKTALTGRNFVGNRIYNWKFQGSIDDINWVDLYVAPSTFLGYTTQDFNISTTASYNYYRIFVIQAETTNPGLLQWQLYIYSN